MSVYASPSASRAGDVGLQGFIENSSINCPDAMTATRPRTGVGALVARSKAPNTREQFRVNPRTHPVGSLLTDRGEQVALGKPAAQPSREGTVAITVHFPEEVRALLKSLAAERCTKTNTGIGAGYLSKFFSAPDFPSSLLVSCSRSPAPEERMGSQSNDPEADQSIDQPNEQAHPVWPPSQGERTPAADEHKAVRNKEQPPTAPHYQYAGKTRPKV